MLSLPVNTQEPEKQDLSDVDNLDIISIWKTIQGEGPFAGMPAVFVRLAGCNLTCNFCDTNYTQYRLKRSIAEVLSEINRLSEGVVKLTVITGGEPFRQDISELVSTLLYGGEALDLQQVQIETNGTLYLPDFPFGSPRASIVCSPKTAKIHRELEPHITAFKYILHADSVSPADGLPLSSLGYDCVPFRCQDKCVPIFVQPFDSGDEIENLRHQKAAVESCLKYGYRLSLQLHKTLGLE